MERLEQVRRAIKAYQRTSWDDPVHDIVSPFRLQRPNLYYPGLETHAFHETTRFPWTSNLNAAFTDIRGELDRILDQGSGFVKVFGENTGEGEWAAFLLNIYGAEVESNTARCPRTMAILNTIPGLCGFVCISAIAPGTHILPHCGVSNARLRCHLPLKVPSGCRLRVATETIEWVEGQSIVFDDSFEHEAWNPSAESRFVLMFDVFHPDLTSEETDFLSRMQDEARAGVYGERLPEEPAGDWVYE